MIKAVSVYMSTVDQDSFYTALCGHLFNVVIFFFFAFFGGFSDGGGADGGTAITA